ncbi:MAG: Hsp20/alpha crystallin family protein [Thermoflexibacter sp.]|uniref:HSP20 family protein n=1 Tax=Thermoflexibacter ruber TaxID=1003 RepID=A0A1I2JF38_9BACT|nr:Hsp20/alpha crystallin family protein [Thermoflexibacter ruber]SFF51787.1 HSP20 family protein [Thermoflexibacter ruber]
MSLIVRKPQVDFPAFGSLIDQFFNNEFFDWSNRNFSVTNTTLPAVNIKEDNDKFQVEVAAPGLKKEDFKVEVNHNVLSISSEKREEKTEGQEGGTYTRREFSYQSFVRSFSLPESVDADKIEASYNDGVLVLNIPKKEEAKPKPARVIQIA